MNKFMNLGEINPGNVNHDENEGWHKILCCITAVTIFLIKNKKIA